MIYNLDCLEFLSGLKSESADLIIVDPPYFKIMKDKWDNQWETEDEYLEWCRAWANECARVLKAGGCFYVWGTTKTDTFFRFKLNIMNNLPEMIYQNYIIWSYDYGGRTKKKWPRKHEDLLMYSKGPDFLFDTSDIRIPYKMKANPRKGVTNNPLGKIPTDVWEKNNHTMSKEFCKWHPTQKPLVLLERIIKAHTGKGDLVMDCFSGSGSTAIACDNLEREFIGSELDKEYFSKSVERREQRRKQDDR